MASELRAVGRCAQRTRESTAARNAAIREASAAGYSLREIGEAAKMAHGTIRKILAKEA